MGHRYEARRHYGLLSLWRLIRNGRDALYGDSRPDFAVLGYASFQPEEALVPKNAPPTFLIVNGDDKLFPVSTGFFAELKNANVPAELHVHDAGGHGVGMTGRGAGFQNLGVSLWPEALRA